ncbi:glycosyltransferase family 2 protein [Candidatus Woesearchaeota archaeon]|nr:glycosyltransferase family 2 protein [Candidatus Woesearchaeota archaeon]
MEKLSIVVPCYNEEAGLHQLFSQMRQLAKSLHGKYAVEAVFVDDGSTDRTFSMLSEFKRQFSNPKKYTSVVICRHPTNKNLGAALKTAFKHVTGGLVATVDADCSYSLLEIPKLLQLLDKGTDIAIASPYHPEGRSNIKPAYRLFLSKAISKIYAILTRSSIYTFTAIFRVYRRKVIENVHPKSDGFLAVTELLVLAMKKGYRVKELPATLTLRKYGRSKMKLLSTIMGHFLFVAKLLFGLAR